MISFEELYNEVVLKLNWANQKGEKKDISKQDRIFEILQILGNIWWFTNHFVYIPHAESQDYLM